MNIFFSASKVVCSHSCEAFLCDVYLSDFLTATALSSAYSTASFKLEKLKSFLKNSSPYF